MRDLYVRILPYAIVYDMCTLPTGNLKNPLHNVLLFVKNNIVRPVRLRELGLLLRRCCPNHDCSSGMSDLCMEQAYATGDSVNENVVTLLNVVRLRRLSKCRDPL